MGLAVGVAAACGLLLALDSHLTFVSDDWVLLVRRSQLSLDAVMQPFHEHIAIAPALIYGVLREVVGMDSALPYYAVSVALFGGTAVLLFLFARRRVGDGLALAAALLLLFLGAASEDLLWAFQLGFFGSCAFGMGMLIALDRRDRRGDRLACALLIGSLSFSSLGLSFAAGALVDVLLRGSRRSRAYVALLPLALYAVWWGGWGHTAESHLAAANLPGLPLYVFDAAASGLSSLFGFQPGGGGATHPSDLARLALLAALAALAVWAYRHYTPVRRTLGAQVRGSYAAPAAGLLTVVAIGLSFWLLAGLNRDALRFATSLRYQYPSALFILLVATEALRGVRPDRWSQAAIAAATCFAIVAGIVQLKHDYAQIWKPRSDKVRATLAAIEVGGRRISSGFPVGVPAPTTLRAGAYLAAAAQHGSPATPITDLGGLSRDQRSVIDRTLAQALRLKARPAVPPAEDSGCEPLRGPAAEARVVNAPFGEHTLIDIGPGGVRLRLGRFASGEGLSLGELREGKAAKLDLPADRAPAPWRLSVAGSGQVVLC